MPYGYVLLIVTVLLVVRHILPPMRLVAQSASSVAWRVPASWQPDGPWTTRRIEVIDRPTAFSLRAVNDMVLAALFRVAMHVEEAKVVRLLVPYRPAQSFGVWGHTSRSVQKALLRNRNAIG